METDTTDFVLDRLRRAVPSATLERLSSPDMLTIGVDLAHLLPVFGVVRDHPELQFALLADLTAVDHLPARPRFELVYHLACLGAAYAIGAPAPERRLRVRVALDDESPRAPSVTAIYPTAGWLEREVFDLFGIAFQDHPDLRRILMPEDWEGAPLRKDYPVQIKKTPEAWSPVQLTAEEFAANVRARRDRATDAAGGPRD